MFIAFLSTISLSYQYLSKNVCYIELFIVVQLNFVNSYRMQRHSKGFVHRSVVAKSLDAKYKNDTPDNREYENDSVDIIVMEV